MYSRYTVFLDRKSIIYLVRFEEISEIAQKLTFCKLLEDLDFLVDHLIVNLECNNWPQDIRVVSTNSYWFPLSFHMSRA